MPFCTNSKPQNTDGTTHNCYRNQQPVSRNSSTVALTVSHTILTVHRTNDIETNSQSAIPVAQLH